MEMAEVFDVNILLISKHIKNIYKDKELEQTLLKLFNLENGFHLF